MKTCPTIPVDRRRRNLSFAVPASLLGLAGGASPVHAQEESRPRLDVPYVPTPMPVVQQMLEMGGVRRGDVLYDLGCGNGRIVVTAAKERGARGVGVDIDPDRIAEANENARKAGVQARVQFRRGDLFQTDVSPANVVTLYLLPDINRRLRPQLWQQLKVGTRVVSHQFSMGDEWPAERTAEVDGKTVYAWTIRPEHKRA